MMLEGKTWRKSSVRAAAMNHRMSQEMVKNIILKSWMKRLRTKDISKLKGTLNPHLLCEWRNRSPGKEYDLPDFKEKPETAYRSQGEEKRGICRLLVPDSLPIPNCVDTQTPYTKWGGMLSLHVHKRRGPTEVWGGFAEVEWVPHLGRVSTDPWGGGRRGSRDM